MWTYLFLAFMWDLPFIILPKFSVQIVPRYTLMVAAHDLYKYDQFAQCEMKPNDCYC